MKSADGNNGSGKRSCENNAKIMKAAAAAGSENISRKRNLNGYYQRIRIVRSISVASAYVAKMAMAAENGVAAAAHHRQHVA